jgi:hypothetical protein
MFTDNYGSALPALFSAVLRIRDRDPGSGGFYSPGSRSGYAKILFTNPESGTFLLRLFFIFIRILFSIVLLSKVPYNLFLEIKNSEKKVVLV